MLDALEAAEVAFEQREAAAEQQRQIERIATIKGVAGADAAAAAAVAAAAAAMAVPPPDTPRKAAIAPISEVRGGCKKRLVLLACLDPVLSTHAQADVVCSASS